MFCGNYYSRQTMPSEPAPPMPPRPVATGFPGDNARRVVDEMLGRPKPPTADGAFSTIAESLSKHGMQAQNLELLARTEELRVLVVEQLAQQRQARRKGLEGEHEALRITCRERLDRVRALRREHNILAGRLAALGERVNEFSSKAARARSEEPDPTGYPTADELRTWRERVQIAEAVRDDWKEKYRSLESERAAVGRDLQAAAEDFKVAESAEQVLAARLAGQPYPGPHGIIAGPDLDL
jgi:chromosome segregation ATPase